MIIRDAEESDFFDVYQLNKGEIPKVNLIDLDEIAWFKENARCFWVVEIDDQIIAMLVVLKPGLHYESENYRYFTEHFDDFLYVDRIIVDRNNREIGIGRALYSKLLEIEDEAPVITCEVNLEPPNPGSIEFHKKLGFKQVDQQKTSNETKLVSLMVLNRKT